MRRRVVITGLGAVTPLSCQVGDLWSRLLAAESGIHPLQIFDTAAFKIKFGGDILNWDPSAYMDPKEAKRVDRFTQFAVVAATDAVRDANLDFDRKIALVAERSSGRGSAVYGRSKNRSDASS